MPAERHPHLTEIHHDRLDPRIRIFRAGQEVDCFALVTQRYLILIDTMATPELALAMVQSLQPLLKDRQLLVINTHADYDHCWGNSLFTSPGGLFPAPIIGHERILNRLRSQQTATYLQEQQQADSRFANVRLVAPTITFNDYLRIDGGDLTLELLPTPGHTEDHLSIWLPQLRVLFAGDAAEHPIPGVADAASLPTLRASLTRLVDLNAAQALPCHGGTLSPDILTQNLAYFSTLEDQIRHIIAANQVPTHWQTDENLPTLLGLPYEKVVPARADLSAEMQAFYHRGHLDAVRAMLEWLLHDSSRFDK
jgi:glyoxylase-like metal-dependent hydrolase (beta-lactamase superfamily II)